MSVSLLSTIPGTDSPVEVYAASLNPSRDRAIDGQLIINQLQATARDADTAVSSSAFQTNNRVRELTAHFANQDKTVNGDAIFYVRGNTLYGAWTLSPSTTGEPQNFSRLVEGITPTGA